MLVHGIEIFIVFLASMSAFCVLCTPTLLVHANNHSVVTSLVLYLLQLTLV